MRLRSLSLRTFRCYQELLLELPAGSSEVFVGENGSGKTNIVEAVSLLSQGRSCLRAPAEEMMHFGEDFFRVRAEILSDGGVSSSVECVFQRLPRRASAFFINDVRTPLLNFIGVLPSITFLPQDLDLFTGAPGGRRNFIDSLIAQLDSAFSLERLEYERILKQRNALLRRIASGETVVSELDLWDEQLASSGSKLRQKRGAVLEEITTLLPKEFSVLGEPHARVTVQRAEGQGPLLDALKTSRCKDVLLQTTTVGPHRDDWTLLLDERALGPFYSRGQQRAAFLALLFVSAQLFTDVRQEKPLILLDDVLSELDQHHQDALLKRLDSHHVLLTTTHPIPQTTGLRTWFVSRGSVRKG